MANTDLSVPTTQKVAIFEKVGGPVVIKEAPVVQQKDLKPDQVLVKIIYSGVCHTDLHIMLGDWPVPSKIPCIGGHEGAGYIVAVGDNTTEEIKIAPITHHLITVNRLTNAPGFYSSVHAKARRA